MGRSQSQDPGKVIFPVRVGNISGVHLEADDFGANAETGYWGLRFRLTVSLRQACVTGVEVI